MTEPTDADRAKAAEVLAAIRTDEVWLTATKKHPVDRIAAALATERAAAVADLRARVLALAETWEALGTASPTFAATCLRAAVTDTTGDPA